MIFGVYSGFAVLLGSLRQNVIELVFIIVGLVSVAAGLALGRIRIAGALALHGVRDLLHDPDHHVVGTRGVPRWYVCFYATYDVLGAIAILAVR